MEYTIGTLVLIPTVAFVAPILKRSTERWVPIPLVVFEIALGMFLGPAGLGWIVPDDLAAFFSDFGLAMLFFLAGNEIDFAAIRGRPLRRASVGWIMSLAAAVGLAALITPLPSAVPFVAIALTSTSLATIMPVLRDSGDLKKPFGVAVLALGAVGEFGPLLAISVFLSSRTPLTAALVLLVFAVVTGLAIWFAARGAGRSLHRIIAATLHTTSQFAIRLVMLVLVALVGLSVVLDLDMLLGAFTAGILYRLLLSGASEYDKNVIEGKVEAVGYGFLVPIFFIYTGVTFDLESLFADARILAMVPLSLLGLLVCRGLPSLLSAPLGSDRNDLAATGLFGATALPIIVAVTAIGVDAGALTSGAAAALVGAGMISVLVFPVAGLAFRKRSISAAARRSDDDVPAAPADD